MHGAGRNKEALAHLRLERVQTFFRTGAANSSRERRGIEPTLEAGINPAPRLRIENDPGFGFAKIGRRQSSRGCVVGMNLDRQIALTVEKFEDQGKPRLRRVTTEQLCAA